MVAYPYHGEPLHITAALKTHLVINDARRVQVHIIEEAIGCLRLRVRTENADLDMVMAEGSLRLLAARFAEAVERMDAHERAQSATAALAEAIA